MTDGLATLLLAIAGTWVLSPLWMAVRYRLLYGRWPSQDQPDVVTVPWTLGAPLRPNFTCHADVCDREDCVRDL